MNIIDILKLIESIAVQLLLLLIYFPKTIVKIIKDPKWVPQYIDEQLNESNRFENYISPVLLYLITTVLLFVIIRMQLELGSNIIDNNAEGDHSFLDIINGLQGFTGAIFGLGFLSIPLFFALLTELTSFKKFTKSSIIRSLYVQCYYFSPLILALFSSFITIALMDDNMIHWPELYKVLLSAPLSVIIIIIVIWFIVNEVRFISQELKKKVWKGFLVFFMGIGLLFLGTYVYNNLMDTEINNYPPGQMEFIELRINRSGEYEIIVNNVNYGYGNHYYLQLRKNSSDSVYLPSIGSIEVGQKIQGSFAVSNDLYYWEVGNHAEIRNHAHWSFNTNGITRKVIDINTFKETENLKLYITDSLENIVSKNTFGTFIFNPPFKGEFNIIIEKDSTTDAKNIEYELALFDFKEEFENKNLDGNKKQKNLNLQVIKKYAIDSIAYPSNGYITVGQKIIVEHDGYDRWKFIGENYSEYTVMVEPINSEDRYFDPTLDVLDDQNDSILLIRKLPIILIILISSLFGIAFFLGLRSMLIK